MDIDCSVLILGDGGWVRINFFFSWCLSSKLVALIHFCACSYTAIQLMPIFLCSSNARALVTCYTPFEIPSCLIGVWLNVDPPPNFVQLVKLHYISWMAFASSVKFAVSDKHAATIAKLHDCITHCGTHPYMVSQTPYKCIEITVTLPKS